MEESEKEHFPGSYQKGGGEEDDGAVDVRRHVDLWEEKKHQDLPRDSRGQVGEIHKGWLRLGFHQTETLVVLVSARSDQEVVFLRSDFGQ